MQLNADLSLPAFVDSESLAWVASPSAGVDRRMLERDGEEVARATSVVRYAPGSAFAAHTHGAGEEFLVLDGVFSDETGDFPKGFYIRNPPGSSHRPASAPGAVILVKLRQMPPKERASLRVDTNAAPLWHTTAPGRQEAPLFTAPWEEVTMLRLDPSYRGDPENYPKGAEFFVVDGDPVVNGIARRRGAWLRFPARSTVALSAPSGALLYRKSGHLA
jgi:quercetin dioxygenase-like cupin family protein